MSIEKIDFKQLLHFKKNEFFLSFISGDKDNFYAFKPSFNSIINYKPQKRFSSEIALTIKTYNSALFEDSSVNATIEKLENGAYAVITGQQAHLTAGPLYTIYKIISAIKICKKLNELSKADYIPVFWNASDDHDLDEVNSFVIPDKENGLFKDRLNITYTGCSVYDYDTSEILKQFYEKLFKELRQTEFTESIKEICFNNFDSISSNNAVIIKKLFQGQGLVVVEPKLLRNFSGELYKKIALCDEEINLSISSTGKDTGEFITRDYSSNLFYQGNKKREKIPVENGYYILNEKRISKSDFAGIVKNDPYSFSPNVAVRPVIQDSIFPCVCYVGGPGECSYFAQLKNVYKILETEMSVIYPRVSATLITASEKRIIEKYAFGLADVINGNVKLPFSESQKMQEERADVFYNKIISEMETFKNNAEKVSREISDGITPSIRKIAVELEKIKEKYVKGYGKAEGVSRGHLTRLFDNLTPTGQLQERIFSPLYYLNLYGNSLLEKLMESFDMEDLKHHIIPL